MNDTELDINWAPWTGLVAFVDILGGRGLYLSDEKSDKRKLEKYSKYIETLNSENLDNRRVLCFSDSIYFVQEVKIDRKLKGIIPREAIDFFEVLSKFMTLCMTSQVPIRGGIAYGDIEVLRPAFYNMIKGKTVVQAYELETIQNWSGIACLPVEYISLRHREHYSYILDYAMNDWTRKLIFKWFVPINTGVMELHTLSWHPDCVETAFEKAHQITKKLREDRDEINDPEELQKLDEKLSKYPATLAFMELCKKEVGVGE